MKKKILGIILILMLTGIMFILTGCGNNDENLSSSKSSVSREGLKVGDYVDYQYDTVDSYVIASTYSGYSNDQEINQETLRFVIYNIDEETGRVDLISASSSSKEISFNGVEAYNNAVYLLNDLCANLYSNSSLGITARSINIEDIENVMNDKGTEAVLSYTNTSNYAYDQTYTLENKYYPYVLSLGLSASEQEELITEKSSKEDEIEITQNEVYFGSELSGYFSEETYNVLYGNNPGSFWIASRCINISQDEVSYDMYWAATGKNDIRLTSWGLYNSEYETYRSSYTPDCSYRVIVSIDGDTDITVNSGTISDMHTIN